ncbi:RDD family protein [Nocardioides donggukensis]|uniref:RDD family protein n=1 Tax=Nocardioides donggukensis TaxID=2774019 RepID=A0A927K3E7_9ACTN|nr:RDD family protein [Nocardioides donggukensis]MBD8869877.1 RDD family protein [Nocardioides donggukensis]
MPDQASWLQRVLALVVDWIASTLVVLLAIGPGGWSEDPLAGFYTLLVFVVESAVLTATVGGSFGKLATRLRVVREDGSGRPPDLLRSLLRSAMVAVVIPPLVFRPDGRGLHDMVAGSRTVSLHDLRSGGPQA